MTLRVLYAPEHQRYRQAQTAGPHRKFLNHWCQGGGSKYIGIPRWCQETGCWSRHCTCAKSIEYISQGRDMKILEEEAMEQSNVVWVCPGRAMTYSNYSSLSFPNHSLCQSLWWQRQKDKHPLHTTILKRNILQWLDKMRHCRDHTARLNYIFNAIHIYSQKNVICLCRQLLSHSIWRGYEMVIHPLVIFWNSTSN